MTDTREDRAMKIEEGKFYIDGDGRKVGPMRRAPHQVYPWTDGVKSWTPDGRFLFHRRDVRDLIDGKPDFDSIEPEPGE